MKQAMQNQVGATAQLIAGSARELAGMLGVSLRQVWRLNATGKLLHRGYENNVETQQ